METTNLRRLRLGEEKEEMRNGTKLECRPMPNVMVALPNIGDALCSTPQSLADAQYICRAVTLKRTRKPLKFARVPQTRQQVSAVSRPKFTILRGHVEDMLVLNNFFLIVYMSVSCEDIARQSGAMVPRWRFLGTFFASCIFSEPRAVHFRPAL